MTTNLDEKVTIAVDFGTTFSGVAWARVSNVRLQLMIPSTISCLYQVSFSPRNILSSAIDHTILPTLSMV